MQKINFSEVARAFSHVDDPDVLTKIESSFPLRIALEMSRPRNWWGSGVSHTALFEIAHADGIPLAWVPRRTTLQALATAADSTSRLQIVLDTQTDMISDCEQVVNECDDEWLADRIPLAQSALTAFKDGHHEAAMALAVAIGEPLSRWASTPRVKSFSSRAEKEQWENSRKDRPYRRAEQEIGAVDIDVSPYEFKRHVLIAPIPKFFAKQPQPDEPARSSLSRHVVAHDAHVEHFTKTNSILSLMLVSSLLREQHEWCTEVRMMDSPMED